jgi:hypothetical protein
MGIGGFDDAAAGLREQGARDPRRSVNEFRTELDGCREAWLPMRSRASSSSTERPAFTSSADAASPAAPAPITMTSNEGVFT